MPQSEDNLSENSFNKPPISPPRELEHSLSKTNELDSPYLHKQNSMVNTINSKLHLAAKSKKKKNRRGLRNLLDDKPKLLTSDRCNTIINFFIEILYYDSQYYQFDL